MESLFDHDITFWPKNPSGADPQFQPTWLDILEFAASSPSAFTAAGLNAVDRYCNFSMNDVNVRISRDDWRLVRSGVLDRFSLVPPKPLEEDERIELAAVDITEARFQEVTEKADEISRKTQRLILHLSGRKADIAVRYAIGHSSELGQASARQSVLKPDPDLRAHVLQQILSQDSQPASQQAAIHEAENSNSGSSLALPSGDSPSHPPPVATTPSIPTDVALQSLLPVHTSRSLGLGTSGVQMDTLCGTVSDPLQQHTGSSRMGHALPLDPARRLFEGPSSTVESFPWVSSTSVPVRQFVEEKFTPSVQFSELFNHPEHLVNAAQSLRQPFEKNEREARTRHRCDRCRQLKMKKCIPDKNGICSVCFMYGQHCVWNTARHNGLRFPWSKMCQESVPGKATARAAAGQEGLDHSAEKSAEANVLATAHRPNDGTRETTHDANRNGGVAPEAAEEEGGGVGLCPGQDPPFGNKRQKTASTDSSK